MKDNTGLIIAGGIISLILIWVMGNFLGKMSARKTEFVASGDIDNTLTNLHKLQGSGGYGRGGILGGGGGINSGNTGIVSPAYQNANSGQIVNNNGLNAYDALVAQTQALGSTLSRLGNTISDPYDYGY